MEQLQRLKAIEPLDEDIQRQALQYVICRGRYVAPRLDCIDSFKVFSNEARKRIFDVLRGMIERGRFDNLSGEIVRYFDNETPENLEARYITTLPYVEDEAAACYGLMERQNLALAKWDVCVKQLQALADKHAPIEEIREFDERGQILTANYTSNIRLHPVSIADNCEFDWLLTDRNGRGTLATGNVYQIAGLPKSGKSKMVDILTASCLGCSLWGLHTTPAHEHPKILIFDTEMSRADDVRAMRRINALAGLDCARDHFDKYQYYNITEESDMISAVIERTQAEKPDLVFIDGINDLLNDPNDLSESKAIVKRLNQFAKTAGGIGKPVCIVWLLHLNQSEGATAKKAGGHSGSQSTMKVAGGWIVARDEDSGIMSAINNVSRHGAIAPIHFKIEDDGETLTNAETEYNETIETAAEYAAQMDTQRKENAKQKQRERYIKDAYTKCKNLGVWDGAPITRDDFISAYLSSISPHKQNANRDLSKWMNDYGIIEAREDGFLYLVEPVITDTPF